jgi:hypothetical protein
MIIIYIIASFNKNNNKQGNDNLVLIGKFIFLRGRFEYVQALF